MPANSLKIIGATVYPNGQPKQLDLLIQAGRITKIVPAGELNDLPVPTLNATGLHLFPGFVDVHVHLREPGLTHKETIASGTMAAARGGYTCVCAMPNLNPVPDNLENLELQREKIRSTANVHVLPHGSITVAEKGNELASLTELAPFVSGFSDDGFGVQNPAIMKAALLKTKELGKCIFAHAEDETLVQGGVIHAGQYAKTHGHQGNPSESEWKQVERDIELVRQTGASYHVCHVSTRESLELIRQAQAEGINITCETAPHYLTLDDSQLKDEGRFRMNPPIRSAQDRAALISGLLDGTILCIATDHAPHTAEEKSGGLDHSLNGIVGLETAFPMLYTKLVRPGIVPLSRILDALTSAPLERFRLWEVEEAMPVNREHLGVSRGLEVGQPADLTLFDLDTPYVIDPQEFLSLGKASPFTGQTVYGRCKLTMVGGQIVYSEPAEVKAKAL